MSYGDKTQEISIESLEEILSDVEDEILSEVDDYSLSDYPFEDYILEEIISEAPQPDLKKESLKEKEERFHECDLEELSSDLLRPFVEEHSTDAEISESRSETTVRGMGVYQIRPRKTVENPMTHAAIRHLRRAHRLLRRLNADGVLKDEEKELFTDIENFLKRNDLI